MNTIAPESAECRNWTTVIEQATAAISAEPADSPRRAEWEQYRLDALAHRDAARLREARVSA